MKMTCGNCANAKALESPWSEVAKRSGFREKDFVYCDNPACLIPKTKSACKRWRPKEGRSQ